MKYGNNVDLNEQIEYAEDAVYHLESAMKMLKELGEYELAEALEYPLSEVKEIYDELDENIAQQCIEDIRMMKLDYEMST